MNSYLRLLTFEEASLVYKQHTKRDFPANELKPWKSIARMWKQDSYFALGVFEDAGGAETLDALRGYAFFVDPPECGACLLDYYAILPAYRSAGLGGRTLRRLSEMVRDKGKYILLETEDIDFAKTDEQIAERERRDAFYTRNGCVKTDIKGSVFGVKYAVWRLGGTADFDACCADMKTLYRLMIPGEKNLFVKIHRAK